MQRIIVKLNITNHLIMPMVVVDVLNTIIRYVIIALRLVLLYRNVHQINARILMKCLRSSRIYIRMPIRQI
nr:MAG TPA: hypothetical protein [Caudoviricetes sp.]